MDSAEAIGKIEQDGWFRVGQKGSHVQFKHPTKSGRVTIPHPRKDLMIGILKAIEKQAQLKLR